MKLVGTLAMAIAALVAHQCSANTWWVDDDWYDQGGDGTEARPFGTIQTALDNPSFVAGDTVNVKAGVYNRGATQNTSYGGTISNRVVITKKVHIKAVEGREKTFIVGAASPGSGSNGLGSYATRCILYCDQNKYSSGGAIVEGFTICGGRTADADANAGYGAGVFDAGGSGGSRFQIWVVDCTISNCIANAGGATRFSSLYRTLVSDCRASKRVSGIHGAHAHSCVIQHCAESGTNPQGLAIQVTAVNCTFFGNKTYLAPEVNNRMYSYNCIIAGDGNYEFPYSRTTSTAVDGFYQLFAPAVGDYRPLPGSRAATLGDAASLSGQVTVIDEAKPLINGVRTLVDYAGNPYPSSGTIAAGAVQEIAPAPAGGALQFDIDQCTVNGNIAHDGAYVFPETYPTQYVLAATEKQVYCYWRKVGDATEMVVPRMDDTALLMPPPTVAEVSTNTVQYAVAELYIDPVAGNDGNNGSAAAPFKTLQKGFDAIRNVGDYRVIHAAAGDYREGGVPIHPNYNNPDGPAVLTNRLCIGTGRAVRFKGAGAGRSFIYGAPDPDTTTGLGPAAIRPLCIYSANSIVQGFTLADGYSGSTGKTTATYRSDDFIVYGRTESTPAHVADCIVTNCHAARALTIYVQWHRSKFIDNSSGDDDSEGAWLNYRCTMESCAFVGNRYRAGSSGLCCACYNCSFSGDRQSDIPFANDYVVAACAIDGCKELRSGTLYRGSVADNVTKVFGYDGVADDVVGFADAAHGDFRVKSYSGATRCVPAPSDDVTFWEDYWRHACGDVEGRPLIIFPNGSFLAGAVQEMVDAPGKVYVRVSRGGLGDGTSAYANGEYDAGGGTLSVSPAAGTRPCVGFTVDGVTNLFAEAASWPITVPVAASGSMVSAIYGTDWYVDDENGSDANYGYLPSMAKKTLAAALGVSGIASGDTVHAAAGTYADGVMTNGVNTEMGSRALVPQGVTLKGAGAADTFIVGAIATVAADDNGCGTNAVRCVALNRYATVQGFTLTGGRTCCHAGGKTLLDNLGAGVVAVGTSVSSTVADRKVIDCVISNNVAYRGGGAAYVSLCRSFVTGNRGVDSTGNGSGTYYCRHYGSIVANQRAQYNAMYPYSVCESTLRESETGYWAFYDNDNAPDCEIRNSLILGKSQILRSASVATNSYFSRTPTITSGHDVIGPGSLVTGIANLLVDGAFRPVIGSNVAIDKGDLSLVPEADRATDLLGGQRVYNGALDVGAAEADWRAKYASDLGGRRGFEVTEASPDVSETEAGKVRLVAGTELAAQWTTTAGKTQYYEVSVRVDDGSAVVVKLNGETVATYDSAGEHELKFDNALALNALTFSCTAGSAEILSANLFRGMVLSIR
ncbi:MAG: hypothetical protein IJH50_10975 [Kiritimatiellae bacterium]|nr:hypothetical protein [Kiritimatiellia bacterium]